MDATVAETVAATGSRLDAALVRAAAIGAGEEDSSRARARPSAASSPGLGATPIMCRWADRAASWVGPQEEEVAAAAGRPAAAAATGLFDAAAAAALGPSASIARTADDSIDCRRRICSGLGEAVPSSEEEAGEAEDTEEGKAMDVDQDTDQAAAAAPVRGERGSTGEGRGSEGQHWRGGELNGSGGS